jgi:hypothetical protein
MGLPFCGALLMAVATAVVLIVGSMSTLTRISLVICLAFFPVCAFVLGTAMLKDRPLIRWGSWGRGTPSEVSYACGSSPGVSGRPWHLTLWYGKPCPRTSSARHSPVPTVAEQTRPRSHRTSTEEA